MSDIIENHEVDRDTVDNDTLDRLFNVKYSIIAETAVSLKKSYINKLHGNKLLNVAVSLSDNCIEVYSLGNSSLSKVCKLSGHEKSLSELVWSPEEAHTLYSAGTDGVVKKWDTRKGGSSVQEYKDDDDDDIRPYESMDVSCTGRVLCAGSQLVEDDAFLVFWDQRASKPLGGYWNSHTDDITQVKFHKTKGEILATGSLDGLINIYNVAEVSEDEALTFSLNVEDSVDRLAWLPGERLAAVSQAGDWTLWDARAGDLLTTVRRGRVAKAMRRSKEDDCYLVDTVVAEGEPVLLAGSLHDDGCLRSLVMSQHKPRPRSDFRRNKQIVRCCWRHEEGDLLVTGGEAGLLTVWGPGASTEERGGRERRAGGRGEHHTRRHKPY